LAPVVPGELVARELSIAVEGAEQRVEALGRRDREVRLEVEARRDLPDPLLPVSLNAIAARQSPYTTSDGLAGFFAPRK
jgi:hypothetical protein